MFKIYVNLVPYDVVYWSLATCMVMLLLERVDTLDVPSSSTLDRGNFVEIFVAAARHNLDAGIGIDYSHLWFHRHLSRVHNWCMQLDSDIGYVMRHSIFCFVFRSTFSNIGCT